MGKAFEPITSLRCNFTTATDSHDGGIRLQSSPPNLLRSDAMEPPGTYSKKMLRCTSVFSVPCKIIAFVLIALLYAALSKKSSISQQVPCKQVSKSTVKICGLKTDLDKARKCLCYVQKFVERRQGITRYRTILVWWSCFRTSTSASTFLTCSATGTAAACSLLSLICIQSKMFQQSLLCLTLMSNYLFCLQHMSCRKSGVSLSVSRLFGLWSSASGPFLPRIYFMLHAMLT